MTYRRLLVRVQGEYACFTRPEHKFERVSYPIMTPSAARGILEAIYWHPQFSWRVREIHVLRPVKTFHLLRNEVNSKMSPSREAPYFADEDRAQRHTVCLRDVDYVIAAVPVPKPEATDPAQKHVDIFQRRIQRGQCYHRPALGTREFAAEFGPVENAPDPVDWTEDLGLMLWDMDYASNKPPFRPLFFHSRVERGVMVVPEQPIGGRE